MVTFDGPTEDNGYTYPKVATMGNLRAIEELPTWHCYSDNGVDQGEHIERDEVLDIINTNLDYEAEWYRKGYTAALASLAATVPPSDPPGDLRAAVEGLACLLSDDEPCSGEGDHHVSRAAVLAIIDTHRCYDEAALAEALHALCEVNPWADHGAAYHAVQAAAIIERLQK